MSASEPPPSYRGRMPSRSDRSPSPHYLAARARKAPSTAKRMPAAHDGTRSHSSVDHAQPAEATAALATRAWAAEPPRISSAHEPTIRETVSATARHGVADPRSIAASNRNAKVRHRDHHDPLIGDAFLEDFRRRGHALTSAGQQAARRSRSRRQHRVTVLWCRLPLSTLSLASAPGLGRS